MGKTLESYLEERFEQLSNRNEQDDVYADL